MRFISESPYSQVPEAPLTVLLHFYFQAIFGGEKEEDFSFFVVKIFSVHKKKKINFKF